MLELEQILQNGLQDLQMGWNMGSFGTIAEFHHVAGDPDLQDQPHLTQATSRGAVRIERLEGVRPVAYETLSPKPHRWGQGVSLCLPVAEAAMSGRTVLTELGPDENAVRAEDQDAILFDMGLCQTQVDFCIRTDDVDLLGMLRTAVGNSLFDAGNPAMAAILSAHPHRIALTRIGRVEVYQMIGGPDTGGKSPVGPHTHILPKLLRAKRTHSANTPIPDGWVPCAAFHPESPVMGKLGEEKDFNQGAFDAFQELLTAWGAEDYQTVKQAVWAALSDGAGPEGFEEPETRLGRAGLRNGIRQWRRMHGEASILSAWTSAFDRGAEDADPENPGH